MSWSCTVKAGNVLRAWQDFCYEQTNVINIFENKGKKYMYEVSDIEHLDGAITGTLFCFLKDSDYIKKVGTFKINKNGRVVRGPSILKQFETKE